MLNLFAHDVRQKRQSTDAAVYLHQYIIVKEMNRKGRK